MTADPRAERLRELDAKPILTATEAAELLRVRHSKVYRLCESGELPARNMTETPGGRARWIISRQSIEDFLRGDVRPPAAKTTRRQRKPAHVIRFH